MERVEATLPGGRGRVGELTREQRWRERIGATLRAAGLNETMTYAFADPADLERLGHAARPRTSCSSSCSTPCPPSRPCCAARCCRGCCAACRYNQRRGVDNVHLYEIGTTFWTAAGPQAAQGARDGRGRARGRLATSPRGTSLRAPLDFFDGKGVLETLAARPRSRRASRCARPSCRWLQPGRAAEVLVGGEVVGWLGEVHPRRARALRVPTRPVTAFELDLAPLMRAARDARPFVEPPRFPAVELDLAIVVRRGVTAERIEQAIRSAGGKLLESARLFDVYRGKGVADGQEVHGVRARPTGPPTDAHRRGGRVARTRSSCARCSGAVGGELRVR